jgi:hypothetical protein
MANILRQIHIANMINILGDKFSLIIIHKNKRKDVKPILNHFVLIIEDPLIINTISKTITLYRVFFDIKLEAFSYCPVDRTNKH